MLSKTAILVLLGSLIAWTKGFPYQVETMDKNGFVIEQLGDIHMYDDSWKIMAFFNLTDFMADLGKIECYGKQVKELCELLKQHPTKSCNLIPEQLDWIIKETGSLGKLLPVKKPVNRRKRGILNFMGEIQSVMFGTLAASDGEFYNEQIRRLSENQIQQQDLIKKQTSVLKASVEAQKESIEAQEKQAKIFQRKMIELSNSLQQLMSRMNSEFQIVEGIQQLDELITYTILMAQKCRERFLHIVQALTSDQGGPNIPALVKPETLWKELKEVETRKHSDTSLPTPLAEDTLYQYYTIGNPKVGVNNGILIIKFEIPLINTQRFTIQKVTPIPIKMGGGLFSILVPEHDLLALATDGKSFADLTEHELGHCTKIPSKGYACPDLPIFMVDTNPSCDTAILTNNVKVMETCQSKVMKVNSELWLTLQSKYAWVFTVNTPTNAILTTENNEKYYTTLKDSGILTLKPGTRLDTEGVHIKAPTHGLLEVNMKFVSSNKVPTFKIDAFKDIKINIPTAPQLIKFSTLEKLQKITMDIEELEKLEDRPLLKMLQGKESGIQYYASMAGGVAIMIIVVFIIWKCRCCSVLSCICERRTKSKTNIKRRNKPEIEIIHLPEINNTAKIQRTTQEIPQEDIYETPIKLMRTVSKPPTEMPPEPPRNLLNTLCSIYKIENRTMGTII